MRPAWIAAAILCAQATAAEFQVADLRSEWEAAPRPFSFATTSPTGAVSGDDRFRDGYGLWIGGRRGFSRVGGSFGVLAGIDLGLRQWGYAEAGRMTDADIRWSAGIGWAATDALMVAAEAGLITGWTRLALERTSHADAYAGSGTALGWTMRLRLDGRFTASWGAGVFAGWESATHRFAETAGISQQLTVEGASLGLAVFWVFDPVPARLR